jgi:four helix bundle protein
MKVGRFEDLIAWQKARELRKTIYRVSAQEPFFRDFEMRDQIRGAALSVMSNIAEGFERNGIPQFLYFLKIANASCAEVRSNLYAAFDEGYLSDRALPVLLERTREVSRVIRGLEKSLINKLGTGHRARGTNDVS